MSLLAFLGGMGGGYLKQKEVNRQNEREDMRDAMQAEQFGWARDKNLQEKAQLAQNEALEAEQQKAMSIGTVVPEYAVEHQDADGKSVSVAQPSAGDAEFTAFMQNAAKPEGATNYPETKVAQSYSYTGKDGNKKLFTGANAAQDAADYAKTNAVSDVDRLNAASARLQTMKGGLKQAIDLRNQAAALENAQLERNERHEKLKTEGAYKALALFQMGRIKEGFDAYNSSGNDRLDQETTKITPLTFNVPGYGEVKTFKIEGHTIDKDGNRTPYSTNGWDMGNALMPYKEQRNELMNEIKLARDGRKVDQDILASKAHANYYNAAAKNFNSKASGAGASASNQQPQIGLGDVRTFNADVADILKPDPNINFTQAELNAKAAQSRPIALAAEDVFRMNAQFGNPVTAQTALYAMELAKKLAKENPNEIRATEDVKTGQKYAYVVMNGQRVYVNRPDITPKNSKGN